MNPRGELIVPDWMVQLAMDGRVFNVSNAIQEAGDLAGETGPGSDNVNPSFLVDVPSGTTAIPLEVLLTPEGTGTSGDWPVVRISTDDVVRHSSGGAAITPINMRKDDPNTSSCSAYSGSTQIVAIANVDDDTIWHSSYDLSARSNEQLLWTAKKYVPPVLIGPASLLVFITVNNVNEEISYSIKWAEFSTPNIT
jgi:hypothetical protein